MLVAEAQQRLEELAESLALLRGIFEEAGVEDELADIDRQMEMPGFWDKPEQSGELLRRRRQVERRVETLKRLRADAGDLQAWQELLGDGAGDADPDAAAFVERLTGELDRLELQLKLAGPDDERNAIVAINSGAGGTESQDWAEMLLRMYVRWAEQREFDVDLLDRQDGEEAGIKSATFAVRGEYAFGLLNGESGVHRLVRISPVDSQARRHTSFASVHVMPEVDDTIEIEIEDKDLRVDVYRASGAGGQHVNRTESAVRITHLPTGIVVQCQNERSQHKNRATAMKVLKSRLYELELRKRKEEQDKREGEKMDIAWGSQIRSYVLQPYRMVKDHRTGEQVGDADGVLDGDIDPFLEAYLKGKIAKPEDRSDAV
ncbi:MAG TPA: peptide chain release factor 2 [Thermoanaerobaculia bacterium]|nr:peptide chain release factor 2 [Thermoanaerobaculia bacterium]